nr:MAG TPA: hypothetical protein [Caudoviricetes sp.]
MILLGFLVIHHLISFYNRNTKSSNFNAQTQQM